MSLIICVYMFIYSWINKLSVFIKQIKFVLWEEWIKIADLLMSSLPVCKKRKQFWETCKIIQRRPKDYNFTRSNCYRYRIFYSVLLSLHVQHFCKLRFFLAITSYRQWCDLRKCLLLMFQKFDTFWCTLPSHGQIKNDYRKGVLEWV